MTYSTREATVLTTDDLRTVPESEIRKADVVIVKGKVVKNRDGYGSHAPN